MDDMRISVENGLYSLLSLALCAGIGLHGDQQVADVLHCSFGAVFVPAKALCNSTCCLLSLLSYT